MWTNEWFDKNYMNVEFVNDKKKKKTPNVYFII